MESEDTHPDKLLDFWEWLVEHRTQVILAVVIALGAGMIWYVKKVSALEDEKTASEELLGAISSAFSIDGVDAKLTKLERLKKVAADNPDTAAAVNATFLVASQLFEERAYAEAGKAFQDFFVAHKDHPLASSALFGVAASRESAQPTVPAEAITGYQKVLSQFPGSPEAMQARVALARIYLRQAQPDSTKAKELLKAVADEAQLVRIPAYWRNEAEQLAASLEPKPEPEPKPKPEPEPEPKGKK